MAKTQASAVGATQPTAIYRTDRGLDLVLVSVGVLVNVPASVTCTYSVEITGEDTPNLTGAVWNTMDAMGNLSASANGTLGARVTGVRLNVLTYSGTGIITMYVVQ